MQKDANHPVRTTEKSLGLVELLREQGGARIYELAEQCEMTKGAIHNHLSTLRKHGYVIKEGDEYKLSLQWLTMGGSVRKQSALYQIGRPRANQLANETGRLVNIMTEENGQGVYLYQARGESAVNLDTHVGRRLRMHNIAIGKAILAHLSRERVDEIIDEWGLPKETENTITDKAELLDDLQSIRDHGFATDREERTEGLCCVAAPIRPDDEVLGAISISAPTSRLGEQWFDDDVVSNVKRCANEISLNIKYMRENSEQG